MKLLLELFSSFFFIGITTFGGGYAMLPILERETVDKRGWITSDEMLSFYALAQCTPGIIAVNTATMLGYKKKGIIGAFFATFGLILPSLIIIILLATVLKQFSESIIITKAFNGIRIVVCALLLNASIKLGKKNLLGIFSWVIFAIVMIVEILFKLSPVYIIIGTLILFTIYQTLFVSKKGDKNGIN